MVDDKPHPIIFQEPACLPSTSAKSFPFGGKGRGVAGAHSLALRRLLDLEQCVEDISDMFFRVDHALEEVGPSDASCGPAPLLTIWDGYYQDFLKIAARCRSNLHAAVAIMDVCRETVLVDVGLFSHEDTFTGLGIAEQLVRTKAVCGRAGCDALRRLSQDVQTFQHRLDPPASRIVEAAPRRIASYTQVVQYVLKLLLGFHNISIRRHLAGLFLTLRMYLRRPATNSVPPSLRSTSQRPSPYPCRADTSSHPPPKSQSHTRLCLAEPSPHASHLRPSGLVSEPELSFSDTVMYDVERTAADIERFAVTWSEIADEIERWAAYLAHRADTLDASPYEQGENDLAFADEIAGMWDAVMDMRHATLVRMHAQKPSVAIYQGGVGGLAYN